MEKPVLISRYGFEPYRAGSVLDSIWWEQYLTDDATIYFQTVVTWTLNCPAKCIVFHS